MAGNNRLSPLVRDRLGQLVRGTGWGRAVALRRMAALALIAVAGMLAMAPQTNSASTTHVVVAAADMGPGTVLHPDAVRLSPMPADAVPDGALRSPDAVEGRMLAGPIRRGEPITDVRLTGAELARAVTGDSDTAGVPLRLSDPDVAALLYPGATVDVVTMGERNDEPRVLARQATVLTVLQSEEERDGKLIVVALTPDVAAEVAAASLAHPVTVTLS